MKLATLLKRREERYTIIVVPSDSKEPKHYQIRHNSIRRTILASVFVLLTVIAWSAILFWRPNYSDENTHILRENLELKNRLAGVQTKLLLLENNLDRIERFDRKLRIMTNFVDHRRKVGIGPLSHEELTASNIGNAGSVNEALALKLTEKLHNLESADLSQEIDRLLETSTEREKELAELSNFLEDQNMMLSRIPSVRPSEGWTTSGFGYRTSPFTGSKLFHEGIDIANNIGTPVYAPADGRVIFTGQRDGYGRVLVINHGYGLTTRYAHLSAFKVKVGDKVARGDHIAAVGNTGRSTGPHLHYEVRLNNIPQNPRRYILD